MTQGTVPGQRPVLDVHAPLAGTILSLGAVPDPVFAQSMLGPGLALDPEPPDPGQGRVPGVPDAKGRSDDVVGHGVSGGAVDVRAPIAGTVSSLLPHAFVIEVPDGRAVLVHLGIDTVELRGVGFTVHVGQGDVVDAGRVIASWFPADLFRRGISILTPVVMIQASDDDVAPLAVPGDRISSQAPLLRWS